MATVPISGTHIRLMSGVPFNNDYKNTRWFDTIGQQTSYFDSKPIVHSMAGATFQRIEGKHFISVDKSIDDLWNANYIMFRNTLYNNKWFYAFVTKLEYVQRNTTYVHFEIDVFQTWRFEMNFKPSYVLREHRLLWNADGSPVINTIDEGLDYGSEYETVSVEHYQPFETLLFLVIVTKSVMHLGATNETRVVEDVDPDKQVNNIQPVLNGLPQPLTYYIHPFKLNGDTPKVKIGGTDINISSVLDALKSLSTQTGSVNNVVSIYVTDYIGVNGNYDSGSDTLTLNGNYFEKANVSDDNALNLTTINVKDLGQYNNMNKVFPDKYSGYTKGRESKLLMYPYTTLILDDLKGNRKVLKNEYIMNKDIKITVRGSMGTSNKVVYSVLDYLNKGLDAGDSFHSSYEHSVINNNPNDLPVITDLLSAFLQGNRNSIENQKNSIAFNGAMDLIGGSIGASSSVANGNVAGALSSGAGMVQGMGNTVLALQGIQAKQKDIGNTPPTLAKMGGNTNFDYGNRISGIYLIKKQITAEYQEKLSQFFHMFGYKANDVKIPNFHTRKHFNYVQTSSCNIIGNFNNEDLKELKSVFDNGITLWHTDDVGNYSLDNGVI